MTTPVDPVVVDFITKTPFARRRALSIQLKANSPGRLPIIVGRGELKNTPALSKIKFLVPADATVGKFIAELRNQSKNIGPQTAIFFLINNKIIPSSNKLIGEIYQKYVEQDGFLYLSYSCENTFG